MKSNEILKRIIKHWKAYQHTAMKLKCWRIRFLLHDVDKMVMLIFGIDKKAISIMHRKYSTHHVRNGKIIDKLAALIDWECARYTKPEKPETAREFVNSSHPELKYKLLPILDKLGI